MLKGNAKKIMCKAFRTGGECENMVVNVGCQAPTGGRQPLTARARWGWTEVSGTCILKYTLRESAGVNVLERFCFCQCICMNVKVKNVYLNVYVGIY